MEGGFKFNTAISSIMELVNEIYKTQNEDPAVDLRESIETTVLLLAPFVPHIGEEMWQILGHKDSVLKASWPAFDKDIAREQTITLVIQVNGKVRSKIEIPADMPQEKIRQLVLEDAKTKEWIKDSPIKKFIVIPNKLVNIVV